MLQVLISFKINFLSPKTSQRAHSLWEDNDEVAFGHTHEMYHKSLSNKYKNKRKKSSMWSNVSGSSHTSAQVANNGVQWVNHWKRVGISDVAIKHVILTDHKPILEMMDNSAH